MARAVRCTVDREYVDGDAAANPPTWSPVVEGYWIELTATGDTDTLIGAQQAHVINYRGRGCYHRDISPQDRVTVDATGQVLHLTESFDADGMRAWLSLQLVERLP